MSRKIKLFALLVVMACTKVMAQDITVTARIDSVHLMIGEQAVFDLEVQLKANQKAQIPLFTDTIMGGIDIVDNYPIDTVFSANKERMTLKKSYLITSFAPKMYIIPPITVDVDGKEYKSSPISLKVETFPDIDKADPDDYFATKEIMKPPFVWKDFLVAFLCFILAFPLGGLLYYLSMRLFDNKPIIRRVKLEVKRPAHEEALTELEEIKKSKSWQSSTPKEYYTELTDVLRAYMKSRFHFNATEMTSSEIITELQKINDQEEIKHLQELFATADLVKFAKLIPHQGEYSNNLSKVEEYINNTKEVIDPNAAPEPTEEIIVEKRSLVSKIAIGVAAVATLVAVITCIYVVITQGLSMFGLF